MQAGADNNIGLPKLVVLSIVFLWFIIGGIGHFVSTETFVSIMPPYIPFHYSVVYISGVFELAGAFGLLFSSTRRMAGFGLISLTILVTPANVHMWMNSELYPTIPPVLLALRLPLQVLLLVGIWWSTKANSTNN